MLSFVRHAFAIAGILSAPFATAQTAPHVDWSALPDAQAQTYEDPYRELTQPQMQQLMELVRLRQASSAEDTDEAQKDTLQKQAAHIEKSLRTQQLDPDWILSQREAVAARRKHAALAINAELEGKLVTMSGYLLNATSLDDGTNVTYLLPSRGVCMHLPPPAPNQVLKLVVEQLPVPMGPCIASVVRGRLSGSEARHTVPSADDSTPMWSRWEMRVTESSTTTPLPLD